ncbi:hypothetical protein Agub_g14601 [Astrephomene gubernaculifera]|uniref:Uncharacterized protein n=1 Tax=Astrephomene gubernaculifera TaxID=47775 RepID=A0AAD3E1R0_9CHLO|nr:hypothetical protein Agub_g14601 [Astrephomene gubernaculifera]
MAVTCSTTRILIWSLWAFTALASVAYMAVSIVTFVNIVKGVKDGYIMEYYMDGAHVKSRIPAYKNGLLSSCMLGFLMALFWVIFSFFVLLRRVFRNVSMGYGVLLATCSHTGCFMLLAGLMLNSQKRVASDLQNYAFWGASGYHIYVTTFAFNYFLTALYFVNFLVLLGTSNTMMTQKSDRGATYAASPPPASVTPTMSPTAALELPSGVWGNSYQGGAV